MDESGRNSNFLRRGIRTMDKVVILTTFSVMLLMFLPIRNLNPMDAFMLNLIHSIDLFMTVKDWRESGMSIIFGVMYLMATFQLSLHVAFPCIGCIVVSWIASCHNFGYPQVTWAYFMFLMLWVIKFLYRRTPDAIIVTIVLKTTGNFLFKYEKSLVDSIFVCSMITLNLAFFVVERVAFYCLFSSYFLSFVWMWLKSPLL